MTVLMPTDHFQALLEAGRIDLELESTFSRGDKITIFFKENSLKAMLMWGHTSCLVRLWDLQPGSSCVPVEFEFPLGSGNTYLEYTLTSKQEVVEFIDYCLMIKPAERLQSKTKDCLSEVQAKIPPITQEDIQALLESF